MTKLSELGESIFDFFPSEVIEDLGDSEDLQNYAKHLKKIHSDNPFDNSKIHPRMRVIVKESGLKGTVTDYHTTERGKLNGGVEVWHSEGTEIFYPHQLEKLD